MDDEDWADGAMTSTSSSEWQSSNEWPTGLNLTGVEMCKAVRALVRGGGAARGDAGMVTSEYAMGIVAAVAFAVVLYKVVTSGQVSAELQGIVKRALDAQM